MTGGLDQRMDSAQSLGDFDALRRAQPESLNDLVQAGAVPTGWKVAV